MSTNPKISEGAMDLYSDSIEEGANHISKSFGVVGEDLESKTPYRSPAHVPLTSGAGAEGIDEDYYFQKTRRSNNVQKATVCLVTLVIAAVIVIIGITSATEKTVSDFTCPDTVTTVYASLGLPDYEGYSWDDIQNQAFGQTVNFWLAGAPKLERWLDAWLKPELSNFGISLNVTVISETVDAVNLLATQREQGNLNQGSFDLVFINGNLGNYYKARSAGNLYGPWANKVPNSVNFDFTATNIAYDFGQPTNGYEMPMNAYQVVFIYNISAFNNSVIPSSMSSLAKGTPPQSLSQLRDWIIANPGKFTYPNPNTDAGGTAAAFIRMFMYEFGGTPTATPVTNTVPKNYVNYKTLLGSYNPSIYAQQAPRAFAQLQAISPYLYLNTTTKQPFYPATSTDLDDLFTDGDVIFTMAYDIFHAGTLPGGNQVPPLIKSYVPSLLGSVSNIAFVAIAFNSPNKLAAVVTGNYIASMGAQFYRRQPSCPSSSGCAWLQAYSTTCDAIVNGGWQVSFDYLNSNDYPSNPPTESLRSPYALPEIEGTYGVNMDSDWIDCILDNLTATKASSGTYCN